MNACRQRIARSVVGITVAAAFCSPIVAQDDKDARIQTLEAQLAAAKAAQSQLSPDEQITRALAQLTRIIRTAPESAPAKACKAGGGKSYALIVVNGQAGWSCEIDLRRVKP